MLASRGATQVCSPSLCCSQRAHSIPQREPKSRDKMGMTPRGERYRETFRDRGFKEKGKSWEVRRTFGMETFCQCHSEESSSRTWHPPGGCVWGRSPQRGCGNPGYKPRPMARRLVPKWVGAVHKANLPHTGRCQELLARQLASPLSDQRSHGGGSVSSASPARPAGLSARGRGSEHASSCGCAQGVPRAITDQNRTKRKKT